MSLNIHHLNTATLCPYGRQWVNGDGGLLQPAEMVCHCLLIETNDGLVLVDTGFGTEAVSRPEKLGKAFLALGRPQLEYEQTAIAQIQRLGFQADDVRHIVVTHLDLDHAGGLADFPNATVHIHQQEFEAAVPPQTWKNRARYLQYQWAHGPQWNKLLPDTGENWFGFRKVTALQDALTEMLLIPLHGHSPGHCGVAVSTPEGWLLHAGDAYFHYSEVLSPSPGCPRGLRWFQSLVQSNRAERLDNQRRLRALARQQGDQVRIHCAHDAHEFHECAAVETFLQPANTPF